MTQFEREEEQLSQDFASGRFTAAEYNKQMQDLQREYRMAAREAAERAYDDELNNW